jgi:hypothetical protein
MPEFLMVVLRLTRSQQMALTEIVLAYSRLEEPQEFVDCSSPDCVTTTTGELLTLLTDLRELEVKHAG